MHGFVFPYYCLSELFYSGETNRLEVFFNVKLNFFLSQREKVPEEPRRDLNL